MRKAARILSLVMIMIMMLCLGMGAVAFAENGDAEAGTLEVIEQFPKEGSKSSPPANMGIKLYFNGEFKNKDLREVNEKLFELQGPKYKIPLRVLFSDKEANYILVAPEPTTKDKTLAVNADYKLTIQAGLEADDGATLTEDYVINFSTRDTSNDTKINMLLMGVMFVAIIALTTLDSRKKAKEAAAGGKKQEKVNPYKLAKEQGKSVEEVMAKLEKDKAKQAAKEARAKEKAEKEALAALNTYKVSKPAPISAGGGTYKPPKKEKPKQQPKQGQQNKNKNKKKKK